MHPTAAQIPMLEELRAVPKVELHRHLEGSLRFSSIRELACLQGFLPQVYLQGNHDQIVRDKYLIEKPISSLTECLARFNATQALLQSPVVVQRVAFECVEDAWRDGIRLLEIRYSPFFIRVNHEDKMSYADIHDAVVRGVAEATIQYPIGVGIIGIIDRNVPLPEAEKILELFIAQKHTIVALDMANDELCDCKPFAPLFRRARAAGLRVTVHAGEIPAPGAGQRVTEAIEHLGAERIGHGIQIIDEPETLACVIKKNIVLEVCPISNYLIQAVPTLESHPVRRLIAAGVRVTVSSDDPGLFGISLSEEYRRLMSVHKFTLAELRQLNDAAAEASFIDSTIKAKFWKTGERTE